MTSVPPDHPADHNRVDAQSGMSADALHAIKEFALHLADAAAEVTLSYFRQPIDIANKLSGGSFDPVTVADQASEAAMRELIRAQYPTHGIYGEEHGVERGSSGLMWVLDPIDGTRAFISGLPTWGTLIGLYNGDQPLLGVMDQPFTGERYFALSADGDSILRFKGRDSVLSVSQCEQLSDAIMMSTAPDMFNSAEFAVQQQLVSQVKLMRYGGDCYAYCLLAAGHIDLVVESALSPYDIQALIPIIENAGGVVTDWSGATAVHGGQIVAAATPALHRQSLEVLSSSVK